MRVGRTLVRQEVEVENKAVQALVPDPGVVLRLRAVLGEDARAVDCTWERAPDGGVVEASGVLRAPGCPWDGRRLSVGVVGGGESSVEQHSGADREPQNAWMRAPLELALDLDVAEDDHLCVLGDLEGLLSAVLE